MSNEVQDEGQVAVAPSVPAANDVIDISTMTEAEIAKRIDEDAAFAIKITTGEIKIPSAGSAKVEPPPAAEPEQAAKEEDKNLPEDEELEFKVKRSELGKYKTPGEVLKAKRHADTLLQNQQDQISDLGEKLAEATRQLEEMKKNPPAAKAPLAPAVGTEAGKEKEVDIYDPEYLKSIAKTADEVKALNEKIQKLESEMSTDKQEKQAIKAVDQQFRMVIDFQKDHPEFKTKKDVAEINDEYKSFIKRIGAIAGTNGSDEQNLRVVGAFLNDDSEDADKLRTMADEQGVKLPEEFDSYSKLMQIRQTSQRYFKQGATGQQNITFEEAYKMVSDSFPKTAKKEEPAKGPSANPAAGDAAGMEAALAKRKQAARIVPPEATGGGNSLDNLSPDQQATLLDTPVEELKRDPRKLSMVNSLLARLGQPALNPFGQHI